MDEIYPATIDLETVLLFLKTPITRAITSKTENLGRGSYVRTFYLTNTAANIKLVLTQDLYEGRTQRKIEIYHEIDPSIRRQFNPRIKNPEPSLAFETTDEKEIKKILNVLFDRFYDGRVEDYVRKY